MSSKPDPFAAPERAPFLINLPGLGRGMLRGPSRGVDEALAEYYAAPRPDDAFDYVNALVSHLLDAPRLSYAEVGELPSDTRAALRQCCAIVAATGMSPLEVTLTDWDLLRAMSVRYRWLYAAPLPGRPGWKGFIDRMGGALSIVPARAHHVLRGVDPVVVLEAALETLRDATTDVDRFGGHPMFFVIADLPFATGRALVAVGSDAIDSLMRDAIRGDDDLFDAVEKAVVVAPHLHEPQRADLLRGVAATRDGDVYACRHLLAGVEGALWRSAHDLEVIDANRFMLNADTARGPLAKNVGRLLQDGGGFAINREFKRFVDKAVFDSRGHDIRHGRATSGHDTYSVRSFVALCGWLDIFAGTNLMHEFNERLSLATKRVLA